jgi:hypothetical protein
MKESLKYLTEIFYSTRDFYEAVWKYKESNPQKGIEGINVEIDKHLRNVYHGIHELTSIEEQLRIAYRIKSISKMADFVIEKIGGKRTLLSYSNHIDESNMYTFLAIAEPKDIEDLILVGRDRFKAELEKKFLIYDQIEDWWECIHGMFYLLLKKIRYDFPDYLSDDYHEPAEWMLQRINDINKSTNKLDSELFWLRNDTDLLELITVLLHSGSLNNKDRNLTRKKIIEIVTQLFNHPIKDAESKLSRATERKKDSSPYLAKLQQTYEEYCQRKEDKREDLRR